MNSYYLTPKTHGDGASAKNVKWLGCVSRLESGLRFAIKMILALAVGWVTDTKGKVMCIWEDLMVGNYVDMRSDVVIKYGI